MASHSRVVGSSSSFGGGGGGGSVFAAAGRASLSLSPDRVSLATRDLGMMDDGGLIGTQADHGRGFAFATHANAPRRPHKFHSDLRTMPQQQQQHQQQQHQRADRGAPIQQQRAGVTYPDLLSNLQMSTPSAPSWYQSLNPYDELLLDLDHGLLDRQPYTDRSYRSHQQQEPWQAAPSSQPHSARTYGTSPQQQQQQQQYALNRPAPRLALPSFSVDEPLLQQNQSQRQVQLPPPVQLYPQSQVPQPVRPVPPSVQSPPSARRKAAIQPPPIDPFEQKNNSSSPPLTTPPRTYLPTSYLQSSEPAVSYPVPPPAIPSIAGALVTRSELAECRAFLNLPSCHLLRCPSSPSGVEPTSLTLGDDDLRKLLQSGGGTALYGLALLQSFQRTNYSFWQHGDSMGIMPLDQQMATLQAALASSASLRDALLAFLLDPNRCKLFARPDHNLTTESVQYLLEQVALKLNDALSGAPWRVSHNVETEAQTWTAVHQLNQQSGSTLRLQHLNQLIDAVVQQIQTKNTTPSQLRSPSSSLSTSHAPSAASLLARRTAAATHSSPTAETTPRAASKVWIPSQSGSHSPVVVETSSSTVTATSPHSGEPRLLELDESVDASMVDAMDEYVSPKSHRARPRRRVVPAEPEPEATPRPRKPPVPVQIRPPGFESPPTPPWRAAPVAPPQVSPRRGPLIAFGTIVSGPPTVTTNASSTNTLSSSAAPAVDPATGGALSAREMQLLDRILSQKLHINSLEAALKSQQPDSDSESSSSVSQRAELREQQQQLQLLNDELKSEQNSRLTSPVPSGPSSPALVAGSLPRRLLRMHLSTQGARVFEPAFAYSGALDLPTHAGSITDAALDALLACCGGSAQAAISAMEEMQRADLKWKDLGAMMDQMQSAATV